MIRIWRLLKLAVICALFVPLDCPTVGNKSAADTLINHAKHLTIFQIDYLPEGSFSRICHRSPKVITPVWYAHAWKRVRNELKENWKAPKWSNLRVIIVAKICVGVLHLFCPRSVPISAPHFLLLRLVVVNRCCRLLSLLPPLLLNPLPISSFLKYQFIIYVTPMCLSMFPPYLIVESDRHKLPRLQWGWRRFPDR